MKSSRILLIFLVVLAAAGCHKRNPLGSSVSEQDAKPPCSGDTVTSDRLQELSTHSVVRASSGNTGCGFAYYGTPVEMPMYVHQYPPEWGAPPLSHVIAGVVTVWNYGPNLNVRVEVRGATLTATRLAVSAGDISQIPQSHGRANAVAFPYQHTGLNQPVDYFQIPIGSLNPGARLYIVVLADYPVTTVQPAGTWVLTAWGDGCLLDPSTSDDTYFTYVVQAPDTASSWPETQ
jgi:hypothetical protein